MVATRARRVKGAGRKPVLAELEQVLADEIVEMRILKLKVSRIFIAERAKKLAEESRMLATESFKATKHWVSLFMKRNGFSLRRMTNLTTLTDEQLLSRGVDYMAYLKQRKPFLRLSKTLLMDKTAIYFEDPRMQTVDYSGRRHVIIKSTGFASMRITACVSVWADGRKAAPLLIHKEQEGEVHSHVGPVLSATQEKAWVNAQLLIKWIDFMFPVVDVCGGKCIVWDSCHAHFAKVVKEHCRHRNIELIVIPGGMTPYLQAGDIKIYRELKDNLSVTINAWKNSDDVEYTRGGNPKPPQPSVVRQWFLDAWTKFHQQMFCVQ